MIIYNGTAHNIIDKLLLFISKWNIENIKILIIKAFLLLK